MSDICPFCGLVRSGTGEFQCGTTDFQVSCNRPSSTCLFIQQQKNTRRADTDVPMTTTDRLIALLRERHDAGLKNYGVTVDRKDLTPEQWAQHAIEEMLDGSAYLMRLKDEIAVLRDRIKRMEQAVAAADRYIDVLQYHEGVEYTTWVCNVADARNAYRAAKYEAKEAKP